MYIGDFNPGDTIDFKFNSHSAASAPITLGGSPALTAYKTNSTTENNSGLSLTTDFDSRTGLHHVRITTASDTSFYATDASFDVIFTSGTVDSISVVGVKVASFTLGRQTVAMKLPVGAIPALGITDNGSAQAVGASSITLRAAFDGENDTVVGAVVFLPTATTGKHQTGIVTDYVSSTKVATIGDGWSGGITPTGSTTYVLWAVAPDTAGSVPSTVGEIADAVWDEVASGHVTSGTMGEQLKTDIDSIYSRIPAALVGGRMDSNVGAVAAVVVQQSGSGTQEIGGP